jgi:hypothetical protein
MPKAVGRVKADLQMIALLGANGVRLIAAARMRRRLAPSPRLGASACRADLRNCVDWKAARRRDGIWIRSGRRFQATRRDWHRSAAASAQDPHRWLPVYPTTSSAPTCPPDRNIRLQSSAECRGVRILIEWDTASHPRDAPRRKRSGMGSEISAVFWGAVGEKRGHP